MVLRSGYENTIKNQEPKRINAVYEIQNVIFLAHHCGKRKKKSFEWNVVGKYISKELF